MPAVLLGAQKLFEDSEDPGGTTKGVVEPPIPPVTTPGLTPGLTPGSTSGTPSSSPPTTSTSSPPTQGLPTVPTSVPRSLVVKGLLEVGFDDAVTPEGGKFVAGSTAEAARWESRGQPGSPGKDTVFLIGKVYRQGASAFDDLPSVKVGSEIVIRTDEGRLTFTVTASDDRPASGLIDTPDFTDKVPGRLVLVGILFDASDDERTGQYRVVVAQLSGATRS